MSENPKCVSCGSELIPIVYGLPSPEDFDKEEEGKFILGGCIVSDDDPHWTCPSCGKQF